jgi:gliding motility-associated-like protein
MKNDLLLRLLFIGLLSGKAGSVMAQNLVPNYSFEEVSTCPQSYGGAGTTLAAPWVAPTTGTPDIFNSCSTFGLVDVPDNNFGNQTALTGEGYAGGIMKLPSYEYREYIQAPLLEPLVANEWYAVSFFVSPGEFGCAVDEIGAFFSVNAPSANSFVALPYTPQIVYTGGFIDDYENWTLIEGCFQAIGGESYITIGNFNNDANTPLDPNCQNPVSYYYIEDVTVVVGGNPGEIPIELDGPVYECFSYEIDPQIPDVGYTWEDGSHNPTLVVSESGTYSVTVSDGCNLGIDSIEVIINGTFDPIDLGPEELTICTGDEYAIMLDPDLSDYLWQDGSNDPQYTITVSGTYSVTLDDGCMVSTDQIEVEVLDPPSPFSLGDDMFLCSGTEVEYSFDPDLGNFLWQDGNMSSTYLIDQGGTYLLTISNMCGMESDEITITDLEEPEVQIGPPEVTICEGEIIELEIDPALGDILWSDGSDSPLFEISTSGIYSVSVTNQCGLGSDQVNVTVAPLPEIALGMDTTLCNGDSLWLSPDATNGNFLWQDGSIEDSFLVTGPGTYALIFSNFCGSASDNILIDFSPSLAPPDLGPDFSLCPGESTVLFATTPGASYLWSNATTADSLLVNSPGVYTVEVFNECNSFADTIIVGVNDNAPQVNLPDQLTLCQGQTLTLDAAIGGVSFLWNDNSSDQQLTVNSPGTYSVTVTNACGVDVDTTIILDGGPAPIVDIGNDLQVCAGDVIPISPSFSNVDAWLWNDGSSLPTFSVSAPGFVSIQVSNACGVAFDTLLVSLLPATPPLDLGPDTSLCAGEQFTLTINTPGVSVLWPDGSSANDFIVDQSGLVFASITNACGSSFDTLEVFPLPDIPFLNLGQDQSLCPGEVIILSPGIPDVAYLWQDGSSNNSYQSTQEETIILTISNACGSTSDTLEIFESTQGPQIDLGPDIQVCLGEVVTISSNISGVNYLWQDGSSSPDFSTTVSGTFILAVSNNCGTDSDTIAVDISGVAPSPTLGPDTTLCEGLSLILLSSADPITSVLWQDGSSSSSFVVTSPGTFILAESNRCGVASDTLVVSFLDAPDPFSLGPDSTLCPGESVLLSAPFVPFDILWQDGSSSPQFVADRPGTYVLQLSNECGAVADQLDVSFDTRIPIIDLDPSIPWCEGDIISLDASQLFSATYLWSAGDNSSAIEVATPGIYTIDVVTPCSAVTQSVDIFASTDCEIVDINNAIHLPNVFSPNGDGINDVFSVSYGPDLVVTAMQGSVFDRWGNLVFSSADIPFSWDGFFAGEILMPGVFVYTLSVKYLDDGKEKDLVFSGDVTLIR